MKTSFTKKKKILLIGSVTTIAVAAAVIPTVLIINRNNKIKNKENAKLTLESRKNVHTGQILNFTSELKIHFHHKTVQDVTKKEL